MSEIIMRQLFKTYYNTCNGEKILYTAEREHDDYTQCWIVMDGIELSYMKYHGHCQQIFMCNRYTKEYGDDTFYFKTYDECKRVYHMDSSELSRYASRLRNCVDMDENPLHVGDEVVLIDVSELDDEDKLYRGRILVVDYHCNLESNLVRFKDDISFYGYRVLKINKSI